MIRKTKEEFLMELDKFLSLIKETLKKTDKDTKSYQSGLEKMQGELRLNDIELSSSIRNIIADISNMCEESSMNYTAMLSLKDVSCNNFDDDYMSDFGGDSYGDVLGLSTIDETSAYEEAKSDYKFSKEKLLSLIDRGLRLLKK